MIVWYDPPNDEDKSYGEKWFSWPRAMRYISIMWKYGQKGRHVDIVVIPTAMAAVVWSKMKVATGKVYKVAFAVLFD